VSTPVLDGEAEFEEGVHRPVSAQHCVGGFEERILAAVEGFVELDPKAGQHIHRLASERIDGKTHRQRPFLRAS
jgi:hypothetical protein